jgi:hypothetical protein
MLWATMDRSSAYPCHFGSSSVFPRVLPLDLPIATVELVYAPLRDFRALCWRTLPTSNRQAHQSQSSSESVSDRECLPGELGWQDSVNRVRLL